MDAYILDAERPSDIVSIARSVALFVRGMFPSVRNVLKYSSLFLNFLCFYTLDSRLYYFDRFERSFQRRDYFIDYALCHMEWCQACPLSTGELITSLILAGCQILVCSDFFILVDKSGNSVSLSLFHTK